MRAEEFIRGLTEDTISELDTRTLVQYVPKAGRTLASLPPEKRKKRMGWMTRAYQKLIPRSDFSAEIQKYHAEKDEGKGVAEGSEDALKFATKAHAGQTRADGDPYITHPMRVADSIKQYKKSHNLDQLISAALLHDTVEDTDTTHEALHDLFGGLVASLVKELTSDPEKIKQMGKTEYLAQKMAAMSSYALVIKLADRLDNVKDIATAKTPEWRAKYKKETEHILDYIESNRVLSGTHKKLIGLIRDKLGEIDSQQKGVKGSLDEACWKGYHKEGTKKMFGKTYPNCVKNKKKKTNEEQGEKCPHCGGPIFTEMQIAEEKDACYRKVKSRYKIWPSAYASGALVRCRKVGAKNWGNKGKK